MDEQKQDLLKDKQEISPLAREKTYGEKVYDGVFNQFINFWLNLTLSAAFSFWVAHSKNHVTIPFSGGKTVMPRDIQTQFGNWIEKQFIMKSIKDPVVRMERAQSMSGTLTLLTPGHFILVPSVWLAPKIKAPFVKFFNRMHYGDDAMEDPTLKRRHELIEAEARPTFLGAVVGRLGGVFATQFFARTIGTPHNWVNIVGEKLNIGFLKNFGGADPLAERIGELVGDDVHRIAPKTTDRINTFFQKHGYDWSYKQKGDPTVNTHGAYNKSVQNFGRYVGQDVIYSAITSATVHPVIDMLKNVIPGLTYKPKIEIENPVDARGLRQMHIRSNPIMDQANDIATANENMATANENIPAMKISAAELHDRVAPDAAREVTA